MKKSNLLASVAGLTLALAMFAPGAFAQGGGFGGGGGGGFGGFDPATIVQNRAEAMRPELGVTNNDDWNVILPRLVKVMQLQMEVRTAGMANMMGGRGGGGGGRGGGLAALLGVQPDPAAEALDAAVTGNAPIAELKADMAQVREAHKRKQDEMAKAQADLKSVVTIRQEAYLLSNGLVD